MERTLLQGRKFHTKAYTPPGKGNPYREDIWTPLHKGAVQRYEKLDSIIHHQNTTERPIPNMSLREGQCSGFSDSPTSGGVDVGQYTEEEIAEAIFDWWISGKPYKQWYADKYLQQKINFEQDENQQSI